MSKKIKVDYYDVEELLAFMLDLEDDYDIEMIEEKLWDKYEISFESFHSIVNDLIMYTHTVQSPLTGKQYHAFIDNEIALVKVEVE